MALSYKNINQKGVNMKIKTYIEPILQTIACIVVWAYIGVLLAWRG